MKRLIATIVIINILATACATGRIYESSESVDVFGANATAGAAALQADTVSGRATATAALATSTAAIATSTAQAGIYATGTAAAHIQETETAVQIAEESRLDNQDRSLQIQANATATARSGNATATADSIKADLDRMLLEDEEARLVNQRQREVRQAQLDEAWFWFKVVIGGVFAGGVVWLLISWSYRLRAQPVKVDEDEYGRPIMLIPHNQYQVLSPPRREPQMDLPALPAPSQTILLPAINSKHVMIVGTTGDGKTITLRELVDQRNNVVVLDPHYTPGAWGRAKVICEYDQMQEFFSGLLAELERRKSLRNSGEKRTFDDERITVATEEMPLLVDELGRGLQAVWRRIMREGRKFSMDMIVVTQSTLVKTLGIEGESTLLDNFDWIVELKTSAYKNYADLVAGMERPAVIRGKAQPAQPVIIPYDPRKDSESPQFIPYYPFDGNYTVQPVTPAQPSGPQLTGFTAPEPRGLQTPHGEVTPMQMREIKRLHDLQWSNSRIEKHVFNQENAGGVAYYKVKAVLDFYANGGAANGT